MFSTCPHNIAGFGPFTAEIRWRVWDTPANFNGFRVLPSLLQRSRSPKAKQTLHYVWPSPGLLYYIYIFGGSCPLTEFYPVQNLFYVQVLRSGILAALLHSTPAAGVSQTLRCGTRNGITELSQRAPPLFDRAAITLSIGPHSSLSFFVSTFFSESATGVVHRALSQQCQPRMACHTVHCVYTTGWMN